MKQLLVVIVCAVAATGLRLKAEESHPFQASLTPEMALYPKTAEISGLSLNIWGENPQHGVSLGFANGSTGDSGGFTWGLFNYAESYTGVAWGLVNYNSKDFAGWQGGILFCVCIVNVSKGKFTGFQDALVNVAGDFHGFQLGVVNYAERLHGVQVGLANIAINNGWFDKFPDQLATGFPIVNWSF